MYRGSSKHKNRPADEQKGTYCPEWTHDTPDGGFATDVFVHDWSATEAHAMFETAIENAEQNRRYATRKGIAFEARPSGDGSWHGFPVPWESIPNEIRKSFLEKKQVDKRDLKRYFHFDRNDIKWALKIDR